MRVRKTKVRGEPRYILETYAGGRKRQFFKTKAEAEKALQSAQRQQASLGNAYRLLSSAEQSRLMAFYSDVRAAGLTLETVWQRLRQVPEVDPTTLGAAVKEVLEAKRAAHRSQRHLSIMKWYLSKFIQGRDRQPVSSIGEAELNAWFGSRHEAPRSRRQHIGLLSALFDHCWRKRYIAENPVKRLERVTIVRTVPPILTVAQCRTVLDYTRTHYPHLLAWLVLALFCGLRPESEADPLSWRDIDLPRGRVLMQKSKIRSHRIIDLAFCPPALPWLKLGKQLKGKLPIQYTARRWYLRKVRLLLKLKKWPQDVLRHTAASYLLAYHQDAGKVASFMGNSAGTLLRDYKALVFKEDAEKFMALLP